jgi:hypothetical protein
MNFVKVPDMTVNAYRAEITYVDIFLQTGQTSETVVYGYAVVPNIDACKPQPPIFSFPSGIVVGERSPVVSDEF